MGAACGSYTRGSDLRNLPCCRRMPARLKTLFLFSSSSSFSPFAQLFLLFLINDDNNVSSFIDVLHQIVTRMRNSTGKGANKCKQACFAVKLSDSFILCLSATVMNEECNVVIVIVDVAQKIHLRPPPHLLPLIIISNQPAHHNLIDLFNRGQDRKALEWTESIWRLM